MITMEKLKTVTPNAKPEILKAIIDSIPSELYCINNNLRISHFLAQIAHESGGFTVTEENLNYKTTALPIVFGNRITKEQADKYGRNDDPAIKQKADQKAIADIIYGGDWGLKNLGNNQPGDGSKFKGRGLIQLTGRNNYTAFAKFKKMSVDDIVDYIQKPMGSLESSMWFLYSKFIYQDADNDDINAVTKKVNGGYNGLEERKAYLNKFKDILK